jgi:hypothetical protein
MSQDQIIALIHEAQDALGALAAHHFIGPSKVSPQEQMAFDAIRALDDVIDFIEGESDDA